MSVFKYALVDWSTSATFSPLDGSVQVKDMRRTNVHVQNLRQGVPYYVRVAAGNFVGYSESTVAETGAVVPSSALLNALY